MDSREESLKTERRKLEAYAIARPILEQYRQDPAVIYMFVEVAWEILGESSRFYDIAMLAQNALNHIALGMKKLETQPVGRADVAGRRLSIFWNDSRREAACAVCGRPGVAVEVGPLLALEAGGDPVCPVCAEKHDPGLAALMDLFSKNKQFRVALETVRNDRLRKSTMDF